MQIARTTIAAMLAVSLAACGGSKEPQSEDTAAAPVSAEPTVAASGGPPAAFAQCVSCHAVKSGVNGVGPSLFGVVGRKAGTLPGYPYSAPLKAWGKTLDEATLDEWLTAPMKDVPGTKMVFPGLPDPAKRKEVIEYLKTLQ